MGKKRFIDLKAIGSYNFFLNIEYSAFKVATLTFFFIVAEVNYI